MRCAFVGKYLPEWKDDKVWYNNNMWYNGTDSDSGPPACEIGDRRCAGYPPGWLDPKTKKRVNYDETVGKCQQFYNMNYKNDEGKEGELMDFIKGTGTVCDDGCSWKERQEYKKNNP